MKRKEFIKKIGVAALVGVPAMQVLSSCSKSTTDPAPQNQQSGTTKDCLANGTSVSIAANHGHSLTVSKDDVQAGVEKSYDITGSASHAHTVVITATQFSSLKSNKSIEVTSSTSGHSHTVTVGCA